MGAGESIPRSLSWINLVHWFFPGAERPCVSARAVHSVSLKHPQSRPSSGLRFMPWTGLVNTFELCAQQFT